METKKITHSYFFPSILKLTFGIQGNKFHFLLNRMTAMPRQPYLHYRPNFSFSIIGFELSKVTQWFQLNPFQEEDFSYVLRE